MKRWGRRELNSYGQMHVDILVVVVRISGT